MDWNAKTIETYDRSANELAEYFRGIGPRVEDIERGLELAGKTDGSARVVELGCGDGRDAAEIIERCAWYEGVDPSAGLLNIAKSSLPEVSFRQADALTYQYPHNTDVYFAFASLLHVSRQDMPTVFSSVYQSLNPGGVFYISLKHRDTYTEEVKEDDYGSRMFYYYNPALIQELAGDKYTPVHEGFQTIGSTKWFTIALQKYMR